MLIVIGRRHWSRDPRRWYRYSLPSSISSRLMNAWSDSTGRCYPTGGPRPFCLYFRHVSSFSVNKGKQNSHTKKKKKYPYMKNMLLPYISVCVCVCRYTKYTDDKGPSELLRNLVFFEKRQNRSILFPRVFINTLILANASKILKPNRAQMTCIVWNIF